MAVQFTLYEAPLFVSGKAARIALGECGADFIIKSLAADKAKSKSFLTKSPFGRLPVLVEHRLSSEFSLSETPAILFYLAERFKQSPLAFNDLGSRAQIFAWVSFFDSAFTELLSRVLTALPFSEELIEELEREVKILDTHLSSRAFLVGAYSIADTLATPLLDLLEQVLGFELERFHCILSWWERLRSRPSYRAQPIRD